MKKLLATVLVATFAFFGMAYASTIVVVKGDTLTSIGKKAHYSAQALCRANPQIATRKSCNDLRVGDKVNFPGFSKTSQLAVKKPASCVNLGAAPFNRFGSTSLRIQGIELNPDLTKEEKIEAIAKVKGEKGDRRLIAAGMVFKSMPFKSKNGKVIFLKDVNVCTSEQGGRAEVIETWPLSTGTVIGDPLSCGNIGVMELPKPVLAPPAPVVKSPSVPPVVEPPKELPPPPVVSTPPPPAEKIACDEWDVHASAGVELSKGADTRSLAGYLEGEVGACPFKWEGKDGVFNEMLIAGRYHETNDNWREWDGKNRTALLGVGLRRTDKDGSVDMYRLMAGSRMNDGSQGLYTQSARWNVVGLYGTHYRVEDDGTNETHYRWGILAPFGDAKGSASWDGTALSLPRYNGSLEAGIRRYFTKQGEDWRVFGEINATVVSPDYAGIGPRIGVCNERDTLCVLGGVNIDVQNGGTAAMVGVQINTPGVIRMNRDGVIMKQTAEAATVNGISFQFAPAQRASPQSD